MRSKVYFIIRILHSTLGPLKSSRNQSTFDLMNRSFNLFVISSFYNLALYPILMEIFTPERDVMLRATNIHGILMLDERGTGVMICTKYIGNPRVIPVAKATGSALCTLVIILYSGPLLSSFLIHHSNILCNITYLSSQCICNFPNGG